MSGKGHPACRQQVRRPNGFATPLSRGLDVSGGHQLTRGFANLLTVVGTPSARAGRGGGVGRGPRRSSRARARRTKGTAGGRGIGARARSACLDRSTRSCHHTDRLDEVPTIGRPVDRRQGEIVDPIHHVVVTIGHHDHGLAPRAVVAEEAHGTRPEHRGIAFQTEIEHDHVCVLGEWAASIPGSHTRELGGGGPGQTTTSNPSSSSHPPTRSRVSPARSTIRTTGWLRFMFHLRVPVRGSLAVEPRSARGGRPRSEGTSCAGQGRIAGQDVGFGIGPIA